MPITRFVLRRLAFGVLTLLVVSVIVFLLTHALGDPAAAVLGRDAQQPALLADTRRQLGLDRPLLARYWDWLRGAVTGEYRGATTIERFLDPNNPGIPDYA